MRTSVGASIERKAGWGEWNLYIRHPSADPKHISRVLDLQPDKTCVSGEPIITKSGDRTGSFHGESKWIYSIPFEPGDEGAQELVQLIERVADRYSKLTEAIGDNIEIA